MWPLILGLIVLIRTGMIIQFPSTSGTARTQPEMLTHNYQQNKYKQNFWHI